MQRIDSLLSDHFFALAKFGIVGAITAAIYFLVMWIANSLIGLHYLISITAAYIASTTFHFFANRHFTFGAVDESHSNQLLRYLVMWGVNYVITIIIVSLCVKDFGLSPYIGVCISVFVTVMTGYLFSRFWVFRVRG
ncbi:GtrA family protein [Paraburkholderia sp. BR10872]|uniref:GtrA family protein n=1 Tax=Paraburkholderia sp. BR10872 TaxID=3236989 RepID=UPI0034D1F09E